MAFRVDIEVLARAQSDGARAHRAEQICVRVYGHDVEQSGQPGERGPREVSARPHIECALKRAIRVRRADDDRVEVALVIGADQIRRLEPRKNLRAAHFQTQQRARGEIDALEQCVGDHRCHRLALQDRLRFGDVGRRVRKYLSPIEARGSAFNLAPAALLFGQSHDLADCARRGGLFRFELDAERMLDAREEFGAGERIESEVEFETHLRMNLFDVGRVLFDGVGNGPARGRIHQLAVFGRESGSPRLARRPRERAGGFDLPAQIVAAHLARGCARQRLGADEVIAHALVVGQLAPQVVQFPDDRLARIGDAPGLQIIEVRHDHRKQLLGPGERASSALSIGHAEHADFADHRGSRIMRLDLFRIDIVARRQHDHVLLAPGDVKTSLIVEPSQIARTEPSVFGERFAIGFPIAPVASHNDGAANEYFADAILVRLVNHDLDAFQRRSDRTDLVVFEARDGRRAGSLGQTVALKDGETQAVKSSGYFGVETRPAGDGEPQPAAECLMNPSEEESPCVDPERVAQPAVHIHQRREEPARRRRARARGVEDLFIKEVPKARHSEDRRHFALFQPSLDLGGVQCRYVDDARADGRG